MSATCRQLGYCVNVSDLGRRDGNVAQTPAICFALSGGVRMRVHVQRVNTNQPSIQRTVFAAMILKENRVLPQLSYRKYSLS